MKQALVTFVAPAYLLLCIVFGGSRQGIWANAALQILAVGLLVWISISYRNPLTSRSLRPIAGLSVLMFVLIAVQLIPLPPAVWTALPGRGLLVEGYRSLQLQLPWLPISQTPYETISAAFALLPPIAMLAATQFQDDERILAGALIAGTTAAIILGQLQVGVSDSQLRFYDFSNPGPVGFFANINHMATLLLASIPFALALFFDQQKPGRKAYSVGRAGLAGLVLVLLLTGVLLNGSLAALLLVGPVLLASVLLLPVGWRMRWLIVPLAGVGLVAGLYALSTDPLRRPLSTDATISVESRQQIWSTTAEAVRDSFPFGTGLGSFRNVYAGYEDQSVVEERHVNRAHNDYLQVALELGAAGIILLVLFLLWWALACLRMWRSGGPFERAATIASAAILAHSVVDYPLRTAAMGAVFAMCMGLMVRQPRTVYARAHDRRTGQISGSAGTGSLKAT